MTASKYWGEERHADAIYSVMLKKVRYVSPSNEGTQTAMDTRTGSGSDHLQWETIRERIIKAGTIQKLVESLIDAEGQMDSRQFNVFFATYRAFSKPSEVFRLIANWYDHLSPSASESGVGCSYRESTYSSYSEERMQEIRKALRSILMCWLEMYPEDFYEMDQADQNPGDVSFATLDKLISFARTRALHDMKHKAKRVRERLRRVAQNGGLKTQIPSIARYSFAITGCEPNEPVPSSSNHSSSGDAFSPSLAEDERYARALVVAQERAQMFDVSPENVPQIAEQLTFWDAIYFREMRPYQCQGAIWGRRHKTGPNSVYSVRATIDQFNALSERVMTSILLPECNPDHRARIIEKWIDVAKKLRALKNFSSLKAIVSALQSEPVFRLKPIWALISKRHLSLLNELLATFELVEEDDIVGGIGKQQKARQILETEGTAKMSISKATDASSLFVPQIGENYRRTKSDLNLATMENEKQQQGGTVPWLGTFLTDLEKLDQLYPDMTPEGLINFEKRRKEFEVLAEIRLFQSAARGYTIHKDQAFCVWFHFLPALNEKECFMRSIELEPLASTHFGVDNNSTITPEPGRRRVRDGLANISSIGRLFSALSTSSPKEFLQQQSLDESAGTLTSMRKLNNDEKRGSNCSASDGIELVDSYGAKKPPRNNPGAGRSQSQGAKKGRERVKKLSSEGRGQGSPSPARKADQQKQQQPQQKSGCEFNPLLFSHFGPRHSTTSDGGTSVDIGIEFNNHHTRGNPSSTTRCPSASDPSDPCGQSASPNSSFKTNNTTSRRPFGPSDSRGRGIGEIIKNGVSNSRRSHTETCNNRKSMSSSSSRSSLGTMSVANCRANSKLLGGSSPSSISMSNCPREEQNFQLLRVGLDDSLQGELLNVATINYKCIKVINGDRMPQVIERALEKHMLDPSESPNYCLVQLLPDGNEFRFPDHCNPFYAVAPDPSSSMSACVLRKRSTCVPLNDSTASASSSMSTTHHPSSTLAKKLNKQKRNNLLRWSSGYL